MDKRPLRTIKGGERSRFLEKRVARPGRVLALGNGYLRDSV